METKELDNDYVAHAYGRFDVTLNNGKGSTISDDNGKQYIDFGSGIGVTAFGICDDEWKAAVETQLDKMQHVSNLYYTEPCARLAKMLCDKTGMKKVFFGNSGAEANEGAIKFARKYSYDKYGEGRSTIITLVNSFHGRTITTLAATGQDSFHTVFGPFTPGFKYCPANDIEKLNEMATDDVCAIMFECVQGEGGVNNLDYNFVKAIEKLAKEKDILMVVDEVQTGNGRTGTWFAYEQFGLSPDLVSTAKGLGNGLPIGATLMGSKTAEVLTPGTHGSTFGGNPVACAGALSVLEQIDDAFLEAVKQKGAWLTAELEKIPGVKDVSGLGLMLGFSVEGCKSADIKAKALDNGLVVLTAKDRVRLLPPLAITEEELSDGLLRLAAAIREVQEAAH